MVTFRLIDNVPIDIDRDTAQARAAHELTDPGYQAAKPSLLQEVAHWLGERITEFLAKLSGVPGGFFGVLLIVVVVIVLLVVVRLRVGPLARAAQAAGAVFEQRRRGADDYRRDAEAAAAAGRFADAIRERFRAIVRALEERALLDVRSGRTADEAAAEAGNLLPDLAADLRAGARLFDDVHYGGRGGTEAGYRALSELDERCRRTRPAALAAR